MNMDFIVGYRMRCGMSWALLVAISQLAPRSLATDQAAPTAAPATPTAAPVAAPAAKPAVRVIRKVAGPNAGFITGKQPVPVLYPNPLAFNFDWFVINVAARVERRAQPVRKAAVVRRVAPRPQIGPNQNAMQNQVRRVLEPMLKSELSFAARCANLNQDERHKLVTAGKEWFDKFLPDYIKGMDPNQQQMMLQGVQGVWFGNRQQKIENPRDRIQAGVAKICQAQFTKEQAATYTRECKKREDFVRQTIIDNLVARIDEKLKLSPEQCKRINKSMSDRWDKDQAPELESLAINTNMWPSVPDGWILPELTPAQQAVMRRMSATSSQIWFGGGMFMGVMGNNGAVLDDIGYDADAPKNEPRQPADE
jgi:hypothetical protein